MTSCRCFFFDNVDDIVKNDIYDSLQTFDVNNDDQSCH